MNIISYREKLVDSLQNVKGNILTYLSCEVSYGGNTKHNEYFIYLEKDWYRDWYRYNHDTRTRKYHITKVYGESYNKLEKYRKDKLYCIYIGFWYLKQHICLDILKEMYQLHDLIQIYKSNK